MVTEKLKIPIKKPKMMAEFKEFIAKGNVFGMAVGIIIGIAFGTVVTSMVNDVLMPPVGLATGGADFSENYIVLKGVDVKVFDNATNTTITKHVDSFPSLAAAKAAGANTWRYGAFINTIINFLIIAFVIFLMVKGVGMMSRKEEAKAPTTKDCPFCDSKISLKATKCPNCTSKLEEKAEPPAA
jgi:large conductance mechanosensitive channel